ncbi:MAG: hypothetical protein L6Q54_07295 [Leptospiraceae bacterium]|nr:hypothetical protein [Leptospiraceae bacterium]MCK6381041.1 hypothetical protein [Leptospiraceae bacterium]NUM40212.1 hypothetical protein [Leptospiraceae bacterium]
MKLNQNTFIKISACQYLFMFFALVFCAKPPVNPPPVKEKESDSYGWVDEHTFQLRANGFPPEKQMDLATAKLLACENARNYGIKVFNYRFLKNINTGDSLLYPEQKFSKQFHELKIQIRTVEKENDPGGNCYLKLQFSGQDLKKKLVPFEDKSVAPTTPGWE